MAPKATTTLTVEAPIEDVWPAIVEIMQTASGRNVAVDDENYVIRAKAGLSIFSWGENVTLEATPGWGQTELKMRSESAFKLTLVDYGKNKGNLEQLTNRIREKFPVTAAT